MTTLHFNGLNADTGQSLTPARTPQQLIDWITGADAAEESDVKDAAKTNYDARITNKAAGTMGVIFGIDPLKIESARWGVIYHPDTPTAVRAKVQTLCAHRTGQEFFYDPELDKGSALKFRKRHQQDAGAVNPAKLPYYLLIVASPAQISFKFQYGLDAEHAVGRLYFETADEYEQYITRLINYENNPQRERRAAFFAPRNPNDDATYLSSEYLAQKLLTQLQASQAIGYAYTYDAHIGDAATRPALLDLLTRSNQPPALVFTATHGVGFPNGHDLQQSDQGALVTREWVRSLDEQLAAAIPDTQYVAGRHIPLNADCTGLLVFAYACYSAGTPRFDDFSHFKHTAPSELAPAPLVAQLPQRLLAHGALAFIGHVERAWDYSFLTPGLGSSLDTFRSTLEAVLAGQPIGHAFEYLNDRHLDLSQDLTATNEESLLYQYQHGDPVDVNELAEKWIAYNDARAYVIFGDPFVRLQPHLLKAA